MKSRSIAVAFLAHHLDHLAPLCEVLDMPLMAFDERIVREAKRLYPLLSVRYNETSKSKQIEIMKEAVDSGALQEHAIFYSSLFPREALREIFSSRREKPRVAYCPHGFSEKQHSWPLGATQQDISLHHGPFAINQIHSLGGDTSQNIWIRTGNVRRQYYLEHKAHLDARAVSRLPQVQKGPTMLYAPTWQDDIATTSFGSSLQILQSVASSGWNILIKFHPLLRRHKKNTEIREALKSFPSIHIIPYKSLVLPYLEIVDAYLGDMSSVAYDFLYYEKPMLFLNETEGTSADHKRTKLFECGRVIGREEYESIPQILRNVEDANDLYSEKKASLRLEVYGSAVEPNILFDAISSAIDGPAPPWMKTEGQGDGDTQRGESDG